MEYASNISQPTTATNAAAERTPLPENRIIQGDCTAVLERFPDASVDLVLTDPPYGVSYRDRAGRTLDNDDDLTSVLAGYAALYRVLKPGRFCLSFYGWSKVDRFFQAWRAAGFRPVGHIVWHKHYASRTGFLQARHEQAYLLAKGTPRKPATPPADVRHWHYSGNRMHPTEKAVEILQPLIRSFCDPGTVVLDPFAGSGSTCVAAMLCGRRSIGIELDPHYCRCARKRLDGAARYMARTREAN